jgi:hypothetical protein
MEELAKLGSKFERLIARIFLVFCVVTTIQVNK